METVNIRDEPEGKGEAMRKVAVIAGFFE